MMNGYSVLVEGNLRIHIIKGRMRTITKSFILGAGITLIAYSFGVIFVDVLGFKYAWVGILLPPLTFTLRYIVNKNWVFK